LWRRDEDLRIESAIDAERFIEDANIESGVRLAICAILLCFTTEPRSHFSVQSNSVAQPLSSITVNEPTSQVGTTDVYKSATFHHPSFLGGAQHGPEKNRSIRYQISRMERCALFHFYYQLL